MCVTATFKTECDTMTDIKQSVTNLSRFKLRLTPLSVSKANVASFVTRNLCKPYIFWGAILEIECDIRCHSGFADGQACRSLLGA